MAFATQTDLDDPAVFAPPELHEMRALLEALPAQVAEAWAAGLASDVAERVAVPGRVLVAGVGGSAIGADIVATLALTCATVPVQVLRGYAAPPLGSDTLLIGSSFSGNTAETIAALTESQRDGQRLVLTTGGRLASLAETHDWATFRYAFDGPPRSALGWSTFPLLAILARLRAIHLEERLVEGIVEQLRRSGMALRPEESSAFNPAKRLAGAIAGRPVLVLGAGPLEVAARRWAGQLNENAKQWAVAGAFPEANHNLLVPLAAGRHPAAAEQPYVVLLDAPLLDERMSRHVALTAEVLADAGAAHEVVRVESSSTLGAIMEACQVGDWVSLYASALNEVDPMDIDALVRFKARLASLE
ncbi:MAG: hypothetical protein IT299_06685 [Dehalococcoidia bacterium]|nr:hypothetical protein [Dehalococcoidia bacterium]